MIFTKGEKEMDMIAVEYEAAYRNNHMQEYDDIKMER